MEPARLLDALDRAGFRRTEARRDVATLIAAQTGHFSAADLAEEASRRHLRVGRATIFRTLDALASVGAVERIELPDGEHAYLVCAPLHHHHVVCSSCGSSGEVDDAGLRAVVSRIARRTGYRIDKHRLDLFGVCPECLARAGDVDRTGLEAAVV